MSRKGMNTNLEEEMKELVLEHLKDLISLGFRVMKILGLMKRFLGLGQFYTKSQANSMSKAQNPQL